jgi:hypothetical protein
LTVADDDRRTRGMILLQGGAGDQPSSQPPRSLPQPLPQSPAQLPSGIPYDEAEFLVGGAGSGRHGALEPVNFKLHEGWLAEANNWWRARKFPYKSLSDLFRHAVVRHLKYFLPMLEGTLDDSLLHIMGQIDDQIARWKFNTMFIAQIESIAEQVNQTLAMPGGREECERMLGGLYKKIQKARNGFFKQVYLKLFDDRFGAYIKRIIILEGEIEGREDEQAFDLTSTEPYELEGDDRWHLSGLEDASGIEIELNEQGQEQPE